jgi:hypothetical protein
MAPRDRPVQRLDQMHEGNVQRIDQVHRENLQRLDQLRLSRRQWFDRLDRRQGPMSSGCSASRHA